MIEHGILETNVNFCIWSFGVAYSLYNVYLLGNDFNHLDHDTYQYDDFARGWFGRYQDISDYEWNCWTRLTLRLVPWFLLNLCGAEYLRVWYASKISTWYTFVTLASCLCIINPWATAFIAGVPLCFYLVAQTEEPLLLWALGFLFRRYTPSELLAKTDEEIYTIEVASSWLILRCIAYGLEDISSKRRCLATLYGFCFYLPAVFCGPLLSFSSFARGLAAPPRPWTKGRFCNITQRFARCAFWYIFTLIALHYVYVNAILLRPYMVMEMSAWELGGLGIAMGQFFHLKYVVFYGIPSCWAYAEGYETPQSPCCVTRVYLYSFMWRYFDQGLYQFLVRYIYVPVLRALKAWPSKRFFASVTSFLFVYVWHGEEIYVLYWVLLNFVSLSCESIAKDFSRRKSIKLFLDKNVNPSNQRRLHCLLAAPLHYFSMLSNYFFIGNFEIGKIYFMRLFMEPIKNHLYILFILYGAAQTSLSIEMRENKEAKRK